MSLEERLRTSLEQASLIADPDVRRNLALARQRGRRAVLRRRIVGSILVASVGFVAAVVLPKVIGSHQPVPDVHPPSPRGSFDAVLGGRGWALRRYRLAGRWTISLLAHGRIEFAAPPGARVRQLRPAYAFTIDGRSMTTDLFAHDVCLGAGMGTYRWSWTEGVLRFAVRSDPCDARRAVLTSGGWVTAAATPDDRLHGTWWASGITCREAVAAEARSGFTPAELRIAGHGRFVSVTDCLAGRRTEWDNTIIFDNGRFVGLSGSPTEGHLGYNGTYRIVRHGVLVVNDGFSVVTIRFSIAGDELTLDVVHVRLVQPGMTRKDRLGDRVEVTWGYESKPFNRVIS